MGSANNGAITLAFLCRFRVKAGDLAGARPACSDAEKLLEKSDEADSRVAVALARALLAEESGEAARAREIRGELTDGELARTYGGPMPDALVDLARSAWERGEPADALPLAEKARVHYGPDGGGVARADALQALILARLGREREAKEHLEAARPLAERGGDFETRAWMLFAEAELEGRAGRTRVAIAKARAMATEAHAKGWLALEVDALLMAKRWGGAAALQPNELRGWASEAKARGMVRLVAHAERAGRPL
jgi:hypothetical protein